MIKISLHIDEKLEEELAEYAEANPEEINIVITTNNEGCIADIGLLNFRIKGDITIGNTFSENDIDKSRQMWQWFKTLIENRNGRKVLISAHSTFEQNEDVLHIGCFPECKNGYRPSHIRIKDIKFMGKKVLLPAGGQRDCTQNMEIYEFCISQQDDYENIVIAYLSYNTLIISFDIFHEKLNKDLWWFLNSITDMYFKYEKEAGDELKRQYEEWKEEEDIRLIKGLILGRLKYKLDSLSKNIADTKYNIGYHMEKLIELEHKLKENIIEYEALKAEIDKDEKSSYIKEQVIKIKEMYPDVSFGENGITIYKDIYTKGVYIGKFKIEVKYDGTVTAVNTNRKSEDYDHPHVHNGSICFGNLLDKYKSFMVEGKYFEIIDLVCTVLQFYNPNDAYVHIERWKNR